jgi:hypothetical protein
MRNKDIYIILQLPLGYDISPLKRVKLKILTTSRQASGSNFKFNSRELKNIVTHMGN